MIHICLATQHLSARKIALMLYKTVGVHGKPTVTKHIVSQINTRQHSEYSKRIDDPARPGIIGCLTLVFHQLHTDKSGESNVYGIDYKKIGCAEKIIELPCGQTIARRTQRRHKGRCYGYTRNDVTFVCTSQSYDAGTSADKSYEYIIYGRRCTRQKFAVLLVDWRDEKK